MNVTNQNQSLLKSELRNYFIRLTICFVNLVYFCHHGFSSTFPFFNYCPDRNRNCSPSYMSLFDKVMVTCGKLISSYVTSSGITGKKSPATSDWFQTVQTYSVCYQCIIMFMAALTLNGRVGKF